MYIPFVHITVVLLAVAMAFSVVEPELPAAGAALGRRLLQEVLVQLVLLRRRARRRLLQLLLLHHHHHVGLGMRLWIGLQRDLKRWRRSEGGRGGRAGVGELLKRGIWRQERKRDLKATCKNIEHVSHVLTYHMR